MRVVQSRWWLAVTCAVMLAAAMLLLLTRLLWTVGNPLLVAAAAMGLAAAPSLAYLTRRGWSWSAVLVTFVVAGGAAAAIVPAYLPPASVYIDVLRDAGLVNRPDARYLVANNCRYLCVLDWHSSRYSAAGVHIVSGEPNQTCEAIIAAAVKSGFTRVPTRPNQDCLAYLRRPAPMGMTYNMTVSNVGLGYVEVLLTADSPETIANQDQVLGLTN